MGNDPRRELNRIHHEFVDSLTPQQKRMCRRRQRHVDELTAALEQEAKKRPEVLRLLTPTCSA